MQEKSGRLCHVFQVLGKLEMGFRAITSANDYLQGVILTMMALYVY